MLCQNYVNYFHECTLHLSLSRTLAPSLSLFLPPFDANEPVPWGKSPVPVEDSVLVVFAAHKFSSA